MAWSWVSFGREVPAPMASRGRLVGRTSTSGAVADSRRRGAHCGLCGVAREGMRARGSARAKKIGVVARNRRRFPNVVSGSGQLLLKSAVVIYVATKVQTYSMYPPRTCSKSVSIHTRFSAPSYLCTSLDTPAQTVRRARACCRHSFTSNGDYVASRGASVTAVRRVHERKCARRLSRDRDAE